MTGSKGISREDTLSYLLGVTESNYSGLTANKINVQKPFLIGNVAMSKICRHLER